MPRFTARSLAPVPRDELAAWHERPGALVRLLPPWQPVRIERAQGGVNDGGQVVLRFGPRPLSLRWVARHRDHRPGHGFSDEQVEGPLRRWRHEHRFLDEAAQTVLEDRVDYALPGGALGAFAGGALARRELERVFRFRHARTHRDLRRHASYADRAPLRIAITGATGLAGTALAAYLGGAGHEVVRITRSPRAATSDVGWHPRRGQIDGAALEGVDALVHLAGESLFGLGWSANRKQAIRDSRVDGTALLVRTLAGLARPPHTLISASAVGFYGDRGDEVLTEASDSGTGFLARVCREWETAASVAEKSGIRVVALRSGVLLSPRGGALGAMLPAFRAGLGGRIGDGEQWLPWISLDDWVGAVEFLVHEPVSGPVNAAAPESVRQADFAHTLAAVLGRPAVVPLPAAALRVLLGELADDLLLASARVQPAVLTRAGFSFEHPRLTDALGSELGRSEPAAVFFAHDEGE